MILETLERLCANGIAEFVLFFSSARGRSAAQLAEQRAKAQAQISAAGATEAQKEKANASLANLARIEWMCPMYDQVRLRARAPSLSLSLRPRLEFVTAAGSGRAAYVEGDGRALSPHGPGCAPPRPTAGRREGAAVGACHVCDVSRVTLRRRTARAGDGSSRAGHALALGWAPVRDKNRVPIRWEYVLQI